MLGSDSLIASIPRSEAIVGQLLDPWRKAQHVGQVVVRTGLGDGDAQVADDRHGTFDDGPQVAQERGQILGRGLRGRDQRVQVVEGNAQVDESGVGLAKRGWQCGQGAIQRNVLDRDSPQGLVCVRCQGREVVAALGDGAQHVGAGDEELAERARVAVQLGQQALGRLQGRGEVLVGGARLLGVPGVKRGGALDHLLQAGPGLVVKRVEELVEVDGSGGIARRQGRSVGKLGPLAVRARATPRRSGWRCPTATSSARPPSCPRGALGRR